MKKLLLLTFIISALITNGQNCIQNSNSLGFNGLNSFVSFPANSSLDIADSITVEAWINAAAWGSTSAKGSIVCKHGWTFGEEGYVLRAGGQGELSFNIAGNAGVVSWQEVVTPINTLSLNTWTHVAGTFNGTELNVYVNGVLSGTTAFNGTILPSTDYNLKIGNLADDGQGDPRYFSGLIDEVRIWHRALSQSEIAANMSHHINPIGANALVAYWRLNDGSGVSISDLGMAGATGTLSAASWSTSVPFTDAPVTPLISQVGSTLYSNSPAGNQWYFNGNILAGETNASYTPTQSGSYTVTVTDINNCSATSAPYSVTVTGIESLSNDIILIQPNETGRLLTILSSPENLASSSMQITDMGGRIVMYLPKGTINKETGLQSLTTGIYSALLDTKGTITRKNFIVR